MIQSIYVPEHYEGDGVLVNLPFTWRILQKSDLIAKKRTIATGAVAVLELDSDYTIANGDVNTDNGGNVVLAVALAAGFDVFLSRHTQRTQLDNIEEGSPFAAAQIMAALDKLTMIAQEQDYKDRQALKFADTEQIIDSDLPTPTAGALLKWNSDADGIENISIVTLAASTVVIPVDVDEGETTAVITHGLNDATAKLIGRGATWHTTIVETSQAANTITVEFSAPAPTGGGILIAEVTAV